MSIGGVFRLWLLQPLHKVSVTLLHKSAKDLFRTKICKALINTGVEIAVLSMIVVVKCGHSCFN